MSEAPLDLDDVRVEFSTARGRVAAVRGVSLAVETSEIIGIVGESGCGKSALALSVLGLLPPQGQVTSGRALFRRDLFTASERELRKIRGAQIAMIFQDPMTSLNPVLRIGYQVGEPLRIHHRTRRSAASAAAVAALRAVEVPNADVRVHDYPHQFSGGMRQRAMIAAGMIDKPALIVADEPTTALDVTIQRGVLDLLRRVRDDLGTSIVLISHNLAVVAEICDRVAVMYAGQIVEIGPTRAIFAHPAHPYTRALLAAIPRLDRDRSTRLKTISGTPPALDGNIAGCAFAPRCELAQPTCWSDEPALQPRGEVLVACPVTLRETRPA